MIPNVSAPDVLSENMKNDSKAAAALKLNSACYFSAPARRNILEAFGDHLWNEPVERWAEAGGVGFSTAAKLKKEATAFKEEEEFHLADQMGVKIIFYWETSYPGILKSLSDAPLALYVLGEISQSDSLAIVGSRNPTPYGRRIAARFSEEASRLGLIVVSGLARGIDTEAHLAAMEASRKTWAVLGSGLARVYPEENKNMAEKIVKLGGAVISEFPLNTKPWPASFPMRNRIISGLSWGVLVVEGRERSGSLITAHRALEQGRPVFAVPGPIDSPQSFAPNALISKGAKLTASFSDILEELPPSCCGEVKTTKKTILAPVEISPSLSFTKRKILEFIGSGSRSLDEIGLECGLDFSDLSSNLFELEVDGWIIGQPGQYYAIKKRN